MLLADVLKQPSKVIQLLQKGEVIVYPTDTIYGIGCSAYNVRAVNKIRELKQRESKPFSIWAPSVEWVKTHCEVDQKYLDMLPGPVTLIVKLKKPLADNICQDTVGVRIPDHPFHHIVHLFGSPIITTSVNVSGEPHITQVSQIPFDVPYIDAGQIENPPSTIVNTITGEILRRQ